MSKKKILFSILFLIIVSVLVITPDIIKYNKAVKATSAFPYEVGLTNVVVTPCVPAVAVCTGATLCNSLDVARCSMYSDVTGTQAGGMGMEVLLSQMTIGQIGLVPGSSLIAAGLAPNMMDGGPAASIGGTTMGIMRVVDKLKQWFVRLI